MRLSSAAEDNGTVRVLVVEDEAKLAALVARGLREEGYAVDVAPRGEDALWMARATQYDAILLDVMLPGADGFDVCRRLRDHEVWSPVLMLPARDAVDDRVHGLDAGADDYLPKPFDFGELLARIRALLRRAPVEREPELRAGALVVDPATHAVTLDGRAIGLTAREFAVLEYLIRRRGEVVTRTALLEHVW